MNLSLLNINTFIHQVLPPVDKKNSAFEPSFTFKLNEKMESEAIGKRDGCKSFKSKKKVIEGMEKG